MTPSKIIQATSIKLSGLIKEKYMKVGGRLVEKKVGLQEWEGAGEGNGANMITIHQIHAYMKRILERKMCVNVGLTCSEESRLLQGLLISPGAPCPG